MPSECTPWKSRLAKAIDKCQDRHDLADEMRTLSDEMESVIKLSPREHLYDSWMNRNLDLSGDSNILNSKGTVSTILTVIKDVEGFSARVTDPDNLRSSQLVEDILAMVPMKGPYSRTVDMEISCNGRTLGTSRDVRDLTLDSLYAMISFRELDLFLQVVQYASAFRSRLTMGRDEDRRGLIERINIWGGEVPLEWTGRDVFEILSKRD